jgi:hypothetical protein
MSVTSVIFKMFKMSLITTGDIRDDLEGKFVIRIFYLMSALVLSVLSCS